MTNQPNEPGSTDPSGATCHEETHEQRWYRMNRELCMIRNLVFLLDKTVDLHAEEIGSDMIEGVSALVRVIGEKAEQALNLHDLDWNARFPRAKAEFKGAVA